MTILADLNKSIENFAYTQVMVTIITMPSLIALILNISE